jgi:hypothetical protein
MKRLLTALSPTVLALVVTTGCSLTPAHIKNCRLIGGAGTWIGDFYVATVLLENANAQEVDLEEVQFELIGYDGNKQVVDRRSHEVLGTVRPLQRDRIRLDLFDQGHEVESSHAILRDSRGRLISECFINETQTPGNPSTTEPLSRRESSRAPSAPAPPST